LKRYFLAIKLSYYEKMSMFDKEKFEEADFGFEAFAKMNFRESNKALL